MVPFSTPLPALSTDVVNLYYTQDALLDNLPVLIFYGPSTTSNSTQNSSRIQAHIYSLAGFQSFARLTIAPTSPLYAAVHHLPTEKQGDEVCRGLAVSLLSYFAGIPKATKDYLKELVAHRRHNRLAPAMFDEMHAGDLAASMVQVDDSVGTLQYVMSALSPQRLSWVDMDIKLPPGTIEREMSGEGSDISPSVGDDGLPFYRYGAFDSLIKSLGIVTFLPTSRLKRAPSRPRAHGKNKLLSKDQRITLRQDMCELLDTEQRYVDKLYALVHTTANDFRNGNNGPLAELMTCRLFPESLSRILEANTGFCGDIEEVLGNTEEEAIKDIEQAPQSGAHDERTLSKGRVQDVTGATSFAKTLLKWLPRFKDPYQDYMRSSVHLSSTLNEALRSDASISISVQAVGEQNLRSLLIEPVQRLPRYSLLVDSMIDVLPSSHAAMTSLLKAKDVIADICALDVEGSTESTHTISRLRSLVDHWPSSLAPTGRVITAVDARELVPPYSESQGGQDSILLLFSDCLVLLSKVVSSALSARGLLAEIERPATRPSSLLVDQEKTLAIAANFSLTSVLSFESENGRMLWLANCVSPTSGAISLQEQEANNSACVKVFSLQSTYEGKASRLSEEIAKSRIEGRYPETMRESDKWVLHTIAPSSDGLGVLAAVFEDTCVQSGSVSSFQSRICMHIGGTETTKSLLAADPSIGIVFCASLMENGNYRLDCRTAENSTSTDISAAEDVSSLLSKRRKV